MLSRQFLDPGPDFPWFCGNLVRGSGISPEHFGQDLIYPLRTHRIQDGVQLRVRQVFLFGFHTTILRQSDFLYSRRRFIELFAVTYKSR